MNIERENLLSDAGYDFVCKWCDKRLVDIWVASEHAASSKHQRALKFSKLDGSNESGIELDSMFDLLDQNVVMRSLNSDEIGKCLLCRTVLTDVYMVETHITSNRHLRNLEWYQQVHAAISLKKFMSITETHPRRQRVPYEEDSYAALKPFPEFVIAERTVRFIRCLPDGIVVREWDYYCLCCDIKFLTEEHLHIHVTSHSHKTRGRLKSMQQGPELRANCPSDPPDTDWESAVQTGTIPPPPLNRRPIHSGGSRGL